MYKIATVTVPGTASTTTVHAGATLDGLGAVDSMLIVASLVGVTGGTLDVYLQVAPNEADVWVDVAHFAQLAGGASAIIRSFALSRSGQVTTLATVGMNGTPALAANTVLGGDFGERMRVVTVTGAGVSQGADITIRLIGSAVKNRA